MQLRPEVDSGSPLIAKLGMRTGSTPARRKRPVTGKKSVLRGASHGCASTYSYLYHNATRPPGILSTQALENQFREAPALPLEIWHHIASFIPSYDFRILKLYTLNSAFLYAYLAQECRSFSLVYFRGDRVKSDVKLLRRLKYLRSAPMTSRFLRHLEVRISNYDNSRISLTSAQLYTKTLCDKLVAGSSAIGLLKYLAIYWYVRGALSQLDKLTSITLDWTSPLPHHGFLSVISLSSSLTSSLPVACRSSKDTLTRLILAFRPAYLDLDLLKLKFPNLQEFVLELDARPLSYSLGSPSDHNFSHVGRELVTFLSSHAHLLQTLGLLLPSGLFAAKVLDDSPYLTSLTSLSLSFIVSEPLVFSSVNRFIKQYSKNLRSFGFRLEDLESKLIHYNVLHESILQSPRSIFPQLEYLSLSFNDFLLSFMSKSNIKVKTLSIGMDRSLSTSEVLDLAGAVERGGGHERLQNLYLPICLHFSTLVVIAKAFPSLKSLYVIYRDPKIDDLTLIYLKNPPRNNPLATWGLEHLILVRTDGSWLHNRDAELLYLWLPPFFPGKSSFEFPCTIKSWYQDIAEELSCDIRRKHSIINGWHRASNIFFQEPGIVEVSGFQEIYEFLSNLEFPVDSEGIAVRDDLAILRRMELGCRGGE
ncbi:hypothetical protein D9756_002840 [Leucocoprinus leucothites]|uniref:Uncharacterized protein n=1 Tax=Leucocoprinus leucothites TaxID=201217 RepID=A0A8H5LLQ2_9AGAR|nr:hypothetical protein D9756_002840 [Leucoagaricus leucothites]